MTETTFHIGDRTCSDCDIVKPLDDFYWCGGRPQSYCRPCSIARTRRWRLENLDRYNEGKRNRYHRDVESSRAKQRTTRKPSRYGLTAGQYAALVAEAGGRCQLCGDPETRMKGGEFVPLSVDHDHACCEGRKACGRCVRGLVCNSCNSRLLPAVEGKPELQSDAVREYLARRVLPW